MAVSNLSTLSEISVYYVVAPLDLLNIPTINTLFASR